MSPYSLFVKIIPFFNQLYKYKKAFLRVEYELLGHNTLRGFLHDSDKFFYLYPVALILGHDKHWVKNHHRKNNRHHNECQKNKTRRDYIEMIIDWECARFTKPDKQLNAYETMQKFYPELSDTIIPLLKELGLLTKE